MEISLPWGGWSVADLGFAVEVDMLAQSHGNIPLAEWLKCPSVGPGVGRSNPHGIKNVTMKLNNF